MFFGENRLLPRNRIVRRLLASVLVNKSLLQEHIDDKDYYLALCIIKTTADRGAGIQTEINDNSTVHPNTKEMDKGMFASEIHM